MLGAADARAAASCSAAQVPAADCAPAACPLCICSICSTSSCCGFKPWAGAAAEARWGPPTWSGWLVARALPAPERRAAVTDVERLMPSVVHRPWLQLCRPCSSRPRLSTVWGAQPRPGQIGDQYPSLKPVHALGQQRPQPVPLSLGRSPATLADSAGCCSPEAILALGCGESCRDAPICLMHWYMTPTRRLPARRCLLAAAPACGMSLGLLTSAARRLPAPTALPFCPAGWPSARRAPGSATAAGPAGELAGTRSGRCCCCCSEPFRSAPAANSHTGCHLGRLCLLLRVNG